MYPVNCCAPVEVFVAVPLQANTIPFETSDYTVHAANSSFRRKSRECPDIAKRGLPHSLP